jgi:hypothetical protein
LRSKPGILLGAETVDIDGSWSFKAEVVTYAISINIPIRIIRQELTQFDPFDSDGNLPRKANVLEILPKHC